MVLQSGKPFGVEPPNASAHRLRTHPKRLGNAGGRLAMAGTPDNAGALDPTRRCCPRAGQVLHREGLFGSQLAQANRWATHGTSPTKEKSYQGEVPFIAHHM